MIQVSGLKARYPGKQGAGRDALRGLDLELKTGRIYALLGPNGAGKTTFLRCLTGLMRPASGSLRVLGTEVSGTFPPDLFKRLGVLMESPNGYPRMTAREYLLFFAGFYPVENPARRIEELIAAFELEAPGTRIGKLSQGNKRKVQLMRSLLHKPALVLWDEPTEHLDPRAQRLVLNYLRRYVAAGAAALITSHRLEQMEETADEYGFLKGGLMRHALSREELSRFIVGAEIEGAGTLSAEAAGDLTLRLESLQRLPPDELRLGSWGFRLQGGNVLETLPDLIETLVQCGARILRVEPRARTLEDLYRHHVEDAL